MSAFDEFWTHYPRRIAKGAARKAWERAERQTPDLLEKCVHALSWQVRQPSWTKDGGEFIPHASTYINQERYDDENPAASVERDPLYPQFERWRQANGAEAVTVSFEAFKAYAQKARRA